MNNMRAWRMFLPWRSERAYGAIKLDRKKCITLDL